MEHSPGEKDFVFIFKHSNLAVGLRHCKAMPNAHMVGSVVLIYGQHPGFFK